MQYSYNDGGRSQYFKGKGGDCVARSIAIATGIDYKEVYDVLAAGNKLQRKLKGFKKSSSSGKRTALRGINTDRTWFKKYMRQLGFKWVNLDLGKFRRSFLKASDLPDGVIICHIKRHYTCVIDGVINDAFDPTKKGDQIVLGYWIKTN